MSKKKKRYALDEEAFEILAAQDYVIRMFSPYHFRVNDRLDIWPTSKKYYWRGSAESHTYDDLVELVHEYIPYRRP